MEKLIPPINSVYVLLGVVFVIVALSLLVTIIMEMVALILNTRAKTLLFAIRELLQNDPKLFEQFTRHPRFRQIVGGARGLTGTPKYLPANSFADIFLEILQLRGLTEGGEEAVLSDVKSLDTFLKLQFEECHRDLPAFQAFLERWYSEKMDFAAERYQRQVKYELFIISIIVASLFNADLIGVYARISASLKTGSVEVMNSVTDNLDKLIALDTTLRDSAAVKNIESKLLVMMEESLEPKRGDILGWGGALPADGLGWLSLLTGFLVSALLLSYSAQLWFDWVKRTFGRRGKAPPVTAGSGAGGAKS